MTHQRHQNPVGPFGHLRNSKFWPARGHVQERLLWHAGKSVKLLRLQLNLKRLLKNLKRFLKRNRRSRTLRRRRK